MVLENKIKVQPKHQQHMPLKKKKVQRALTQSQTGQPCLAGVAQLPSEKSGQDWPLPFIYVTLTKKVKVQLKHQQQYQLQKNKVQTVPRPDRTCLPGQGPSGPFYPSTCSGRCMSV